MSAEVLVHRTSWQRIAAMVTAVLIGFACLATASGNGPVIPKGKGDSCVAETDFMRRNHMDLLIHQRDETVLEGIRDKPFSLTECVDCHVQKAESGEHIRIDAEGQFCQSCHTYAAVKIDCFGCHAAKPDTTDSAALGAASESTVAKLAPSTLSHLLAMSRYVRKQAHDD